ncbi:hypothetical protein WAF17_02730 [Bernardetia sp. ABR2-2B]|uniref:hypothetical protein n=1 Tax=Bernardetia sp. ABR2-2B TaxID=3127472 RepID=UPI0030CD1571
MSNSNVTTVKKETTKNAPKNGAKQPTAAEIKKQIEKLEKENANLIQDLTHEAQSNEELKQEAEKLEIQNATLKANLKAVEEQAKTQLEKEKEQIRLKAAKQIELLKKEKEAAMKPTHRTATEKQERLQELNTINLKLVQKNKFFKSFITMRNNPQNEQMQISFIPLNSESITFGTPDLVSFVCDSLIEYMKGNITDLEKELLNYQI